MIRGFALKIRPIASLAALLAALVAAAPAPLLAQSAQRELDARAYIDVSHKVLPSVVNISIAPREDYKPTQEEQYKEMMEMFAEDGSFRAPTSTVSGSGVVIRVQDGKGYVITNNHVVEGFKPERAVLTLTFHQLDSSGVDFTRTTEISGEGLRVMGRDRLSDLAVIEFSLPAGFEVAPIEFADSDKLEVGENILVLGNPLDLNHTVSRGIISAKDRSLGTGISIERLIQTDATIQPGNSGGPMVNLDGKIVGISNAIASRNGLWQGIGFAIPSNDANRISSQLIELGRVVRGYLGVNMKEVGFNPQLVASYRLDSPEGVYVENVVRDSPADVAGVHVGDVVIAIDGRRIRNPDDMLQVISRKPVNTDVAIEVVRVPEGAGKEPVRLTMNAKLTERPNEELIRKLHQPESSNTVIPRITEQPEVQDNRLLGLGLKEFIDKQAGTSGLRVESVSPGSAAERAGVRAGDVIIMLNGRSVRTLGDFRAALTQPIQGSQILRFLRDGKAEMVMIGSK